MIYAAKETMKQICEETLYTCFFKGVSENKILFLSLCTQVKILNVYNKFLGQNNDSLQD